MFRRGDLGEQAVHRFDRFLVTGSVIALGECGKFEQFKVSGNRPIDVECRVEPRFVQLGAGLPGGLDHFTEHRPVGGGDIFVRSEEFFLMNFFETAGGFEDRRDRVGFDVSGPGEHHFLTGRGERGGDRYPG